MTLDDQNPFLTSDTITLNRLFDKGIYVHHENQPKGELIEPRDEKVDTSLKVVVDFNKLSDAGRKQISAILSFLKVDASPNTWLDVTKFSVSQWELEGQGPALIFADPAFEAYNLPQPFLLKKNKWGIHVLVAGDADELASNAANKRELLAQLKVMFNIK